MCGGVFYASNRTKTEFLNRCFYRSACHSYQLWRSALPADGFAEARQHRRFAAAASAAAVLPAVRSGWCAVFFKKEGRSNPFPAADRSGSVGVSALLRAALCRSGRGKLSALECGGVSAAGARGSASRKEEDAASVMITNCNHDNTNCNTNDVYIKNRRIHKILG